MKIYHNPRCSKSRETLKLIEAQGITPEIKLYLNEPPSVDELREVLDQLGISPQQLLRKNEAVYKENYKNKELTDEQWIKAMCEHPKLIERPIVIADGRAIIGRPPEQVKTLF